MRNWFNKQFVLSFIFFLLFLAAVIANQMDIFKTFTTVPVVMAKEEIKKDTIITNDKVWIYQMPRELVQKGMFHELKDILGRTATQEILPGQYVSAFSVDASILRPTSKHEFFPIPNDWLIGIQGTVRRYDLVNISTVLTGKKQNNDLNILEDKNQDYVFEKVPVAYVKGSKNDEITGVNSGNDRLYGTQNPSSIQLSLTLEQFKELEKLYLEGNRFVLSY